MKINSPTRLGLIGYSSTLGFQIFKLKWGAHREYFRTIVVRIAQKFHLPLRVIMSHVMVMAGYIYYGAYRGREVKANWKYQQMDYSHCHWRWYQEKEKKEKTQGDIKKYIVTGFVLVVWVLECNAWKCYRKWAVSSSI